MYWFCFALHWCKWASRWDSWENFMERLKKSTLWSGITAIVSTDPHKRGWVLKQQLHSCRALKKCMWFAVVTVWHCLMSVWAAMQQICHSARLRMEQALQSCQSQPRPGDFRFLKLWIALPNHETPLCRFHLYLMRRCENSWLCLRLTRCRA